MKYSAATRARIAESKDAHDREMRGYAHFMATGRAPDELQALLVAKFPAINRDYAAELAKIYARKGDSAWL